MIIHPESHAVAAGGQGASRAAARLLALQARQLLACAEEILELSGEVDALLVAQEASKNATALLVATNDGPRKTFACKR